MSGVLKLDAGSKYISSLSSRPTPPVSVSNASTLSAANGVAAHLPNPRVTVDPSLNRVILEYFNSSGVLTNQFPSQKQLAAYRLAEASGTPEAAIVSRNL